MDSTYAINEVKLLSKPRVTSVRKCDCRIREIVTEAEGSPWVVFWENVATCLLPVHLLDGPAADL